MKAYILTAQPTKGGLEFNAKVFSSLKKTITYLEKKGLEFDLEAKQAYSDKFVYRIEVYNID